MGIHDGHRERMKKRVARYGLESFDDINVLEVLLFYAIPRSDTNALAHALMDHFGSLSAVLEASYAELLQVEGVGENTAVLLRLIPQVSRRYMMNKEHKGAQLTSAALAGKYAVPFFMFEKEEVVYLFMLDAKRKVLACEEMARGEVNSARVSVRRIVERSLANRASSVILAHNHLSGIALPSRDDEVTTKRVASALELVNIELSDHIIVAGDDFVSMAESGIVRLR